MYDGESCVTDYRMLLEEAGKFHGDICAGIQIGTRMIMSGLKRLGPTDPFGSDRKKLMVFVGIDRCANMLDGREVEVGGTVFFKPCSEGSNYYKVINSSI